jgi:hypothetical protein
MRSVSFDILEAMSESASRAHVVPEDGQSGVVHYKVSPRKGRSECGVFNPRYFTIWKDSVTCRKCIQTHAFREEHDMSGFTERVEANKRRSFEF